MRAHQSLTATIERIIPDFIQFSTRVVYKLFFDKFVFLQKVVQRDSNAGIFTLTRTYPVFAVRRRRRYIQAV